MRRSSRAASLATSSASSRASAAPATEGSGVIVRARPGREAKDEALVRKLGGTVHLRLRIIDGFSAAVPAGALPKLRTNTAIFSVTRNTKLRPQSSSYSTGYDPSSDGSTTGLASAEAAGNSWSGGLWNGNSWTGGSWAGAFWG